MNRNILLYILAFMLLMSFATGGLPDILQTLINQPLVGISLIAGLVIGISLHEFSHALVAYRLGDPTAKLQGRLTIDPRSHLDPLGTFALLFLGFGWGKPTPFDPFNLRNIKRDSALISIAGALTNFLIAIIASIPYLVMFYTHNLSLEIATAYQYLSPFIWINVILGVFNLIPVAPLDGFKVLAGLLPQDWYEDFVRMEQYGIFILIILLVTGVIGKILSPIVGIILNLLLPGFSAGF
ncbi:MAG: site-2 protease family protein [Candidatus Curtissbacteria bacterium]|nr:site-2 protease family protein [Candidatus Curtissbacteria bacterium]